MGEASFSTSFYFLPFIHKNVTFLQIPFLTVNTCRSSLDRVDLLTAFHTFLCSAPLFLLPGDCETSPSLMNTLVKFPLQNSGSNFYKERLFRCVCGAKAPPKLGVWYFPTVGKGFVVVT